MRSDNVCDYCKKNGDRRACYECNDHYYFEGIEAEPVDQVAMMFARFTEDDHPCHYGYYSEYCSNTITQKCHDSDKPCYMRDDTIRDCWLHAIKEGWLDDERHD